ncbi:Xanthine/uracil/vitamin C permease [Thamnidium elegans]|nr:Xanthine/uracil/vitamin C permease [Thamnidium elegans]
MFSGVIILPSLFFSGLSTIVFFIVTGGRVPAYLGCSGSATSIILSITGYDYTSSSGLNPNTSQVQGAMLILSILYTIVAVIVIIFGYAWLEFLMPPVVTGSIITSIGIHLAFISYLEITKSPFDSYMSAVTAGSIILISIYAPTKSLRRISLLLGAIIGYAVHAICGTKNIGPTINYSEIVSSPWLRAPTIHYNIEFNEHSIGTMMPLLIILLAENLGHMKAIESIMTNEKPLMKYVGRAYLGDAFGCMMASLGGTLPFTTYADNIGVLSVTQVFSTLVILCAAVIAMLLGFFAKFSAIVGSIPAGVLGGVTLILYSLITITGIKIWVDNKVDFNDSRNVYVGGIPVVLAAVIQTPLKLGILQLDGIGVATFLSIILHQLLRGHEFLKHCMRRN